MRAFIANTHTDTHTQAVAGSHADTTSGRVIPQQTSDHRCCRVSWSGLKKTCQTLSVYARVCLLVSARVCLKEG